MFLFQRFGAQCDEVLGEVPIQITFTLTINVTGSIKSEKYKERLKVLLVENTFWTTR